MKSPIKYNSYLKIVLPIDEDCDLIEYTHHFSIKPSYITLGDGKKEFVYNNIWKGDYKIRTASESHHINTCKDFRQTFGKIECENKNYYTLSKRLIPIPPEFIRIKLHDIGWKTIFNNFDKVISVCDYLKDEAVQHTTGANCSIPIAIENIDINKVTPENLKHPAVLIIQNHQLKDKSDALVEFSKVVEKLPNVNFYVSKGLTENQGTEGYKNVKKSLSKYKNVSFINVNSSNKYNYLKAADIYVLASGLDCTPATILEASIMEKPVLASKIGGVPEMIIEGKTGWTIENGDTSRWVELITKLTKNKETRTKIGKSARKYALEKYSTAKVAEEIYKTITS